MSRFFLNYLFNIKVSVLWFVSFSGAPCCIYNIHFLDFNLIFLNWFLRRSETLQYSLRWMTRVARMNRTSLLSHHHHRSPSQCCGSWQEHVKMACWCAQCCKFGSPEVGILKKKDFKNMKTHYRRKKKD